MSVFSMLFYSLNMDAPLKSPRIPAKIRAYVAKARGAKLQVPYLTDHRTDLRVASKNRRGLAAYAWFDKQLAIGQWNNLSTLVALYHNCRSWV